MVNRELASRKAFREQYPSVREVSSPGDVPDEQCQCSTCKALCHLSRAIVVGGTDVACFQHVSALGDGQITVLIKYTDEELKQMLQRVKSRSDKAGKVGPSLIGAVEVLEQRKTGRKVCSGLCVTPDRGILTGCTTAMLSASLHR